MRELVHRQICPEYVIKSKPVYGRCIPLIDDSTDLSFLPNLNHLKKGLANLTKFLNPILLGEQILSDLIKSQWIIYAMFVAAASITIVWICLMRVFMHAMVWTSMVVLVVLLSSSSIYCSSRYMEVYNTTTKSSNESVFDLIGISLSTNPDVYTNLPSLWLTLSIGSGLMALIMSMVIIFLRKKVQVAIELLKESSKAIQNTKSTLVFPLVPSLLQLVTISWFTLVGVYLVSSGEPQYRLELNDCPDSKCIIKGKPIENFAFECNPDNASFACDDCKEAHCIFYRYDTTSTVDWFQVIR